MSVSSGQTLSASSGATLAIGGVIGGTGGVTVIGAGTVVLQQANTFSGGIAINGGTLSVGTDSDLGNVANNITLANGTLLATANFTSARSIALSTAGSISVGAGDLLTLGGTISGTGATLNSLGAGTLELSSMETYTGGTIVTNGTLQLLLGSLASPVSVNNLGTLSGYGTIAGAVTVAYGGTLAPGPAGGAMLQMSSLNMAFGSTFVTALNGAGASNYASVSVQGANDAQQSIAGSDGRLCAQWWRQL